MAPNTAVDWVSVFKNRFECLSSGFATTYTEGTANTGRDASEVLTAIKNRISPDNKFHLDEEDKFYRNEEFYSELHAYHYNLLPSKERETWRMEHEGEQFNYQSYKKLKELVKQK